MMVFKKSQIVTVSLVVMLIIAGYLNFLYTEEGGGLGGESLPVSQLEGEEENVDSYGEAKFVSAPADAKQNYFAQTKLTKEKTRSESLAILKQVAENTEADPEARQKAQQEIVRVAKNVEVEGNIENVLLGKGFSQVSVFIGEEGITVAVMTEGLSAPEVAKIRDTVMSESKVSADQIKIMEIK